MLSLMQGRGRSAGMLLPCFLLCCVKDIFPLPLICFKVSIKIGLEDGDCSRGKLEGRHVENFQSRIFLRQLGAWI